MDLSHAQWMGLILALTLIAGGRALWKKRISVLSLEDADRLLEAIRRPSGLGFGGMILLAILGILFDRNFPEQRAAISATVVGALVLWLAFVTLQAAAAIGKVGLADPLRKGYLTSRALQIAGLAVLGVSLALH